MGMIVRFLFLRVTGRIDHSGVKKFLLQLYNLHRAKQFIKIFQSAVFKPGSNPEK
jgi:hypothetical protein